MSALVLISVLFPPSLGDSVVFEVLGFGDPRCFRLWSLLSASFEGFLSLFSAARLLFGFGSVSSSELDMLLLLVPCGKSVI